MHANIIRDGLEVTQNLLRLVDDGLVLQDGAVMRQVDRCRLGIELAGDALGIRVTLAECLQGGNGFCKECVAYVLGCVREKRKVCDTLSETE